jgi:hypothetical protein
VVSTGLNVGFLSVMQEGNSYLGGYLVTNVWGRPLEFRLSSAVQPNRVQQVLYAGTLAPYICGELIGKTLVDRAGVQPQMVVTTCEDALDLRLRVDCPVVWLVPPEDVRAAVQLPGEKGGLVCHLRYPGDAAAVEELLKQVAGNVDLAEPFGRIREAVAEARKMGVTGRAAA